MGFLSGVGKFFGNAVKGVAGALTGQWGSVISAGANLLGGVIGSKSQENINQANIEMARETNAFNERMQDKQNQWNLDQWNRQNEYNTPAAQRQRLEDAGLNPLHYGLDGTGNAGAMASATPAAGVMPQLQNPGLAIQAALANVANVAADTELKKAQANNLNAGAGLSTEQAETERQMRVGNIELQGLTIKFKQFENAYIQPAELDKINAESKKLNTEREQLSDYLKLAQNKDAREEALRQIAQSHLDNETKKIANDFIIAYGHLLNDDKRTSSEVELNGARIVLTKAQADTEFYRSIGQQKTNSILDSQAAIASAQASTAADDAQLQHDMLQYSHDSAKIEWQFIMDEGDGTRWLRKSISKWSNTLSDITEVIKPVSGSFRPAPLHTTYKMGSTYVYPQN